MWRPEFSWGKAIFIVLRLAVYGSVGVILLALFVPQFWPRLTGGTRGRYIRQQKGYATAFKAGDTSVPLFSMDWFAPTVHFCRVSQSGKGSARRDVGYAIQAGVSISLDQTNLQSLIKAIGELPMPPKHAPPVERQIVVGCIRSNEWFHAIYDRADIPRELERISEITGAYLPWYIPTVQGYSVARAGEGGFFCVATEAPIAVSAGENYLQVWNLSNALQKASPPLKLISGRPSLHEYEHPIAISPDGLIIAAATDDGLFVLDWKKEKLLWNAGPLEHQDYFGKHLAIGNGGRTLFAAGAHTIERCDLLTGEQVRVIARRAGWDGIVRFLKTSRNGRVLVAGFGLEGNLRPRSFKIWDLNADRQAFEFDDAEGAEADISPDGEWIALSHFGETKLTFLKWRTGERREIPMRNAGSCYSVFWSPDGEHFAAYGDSTYPASVFIYDSDWKPVGRWDCGRVGQGSDFSFGKDGTIYQIRDNELNALDIERLKRPVN